MSLVSLLRKKYHKALFTTPSHAQKTFIYHKLHNLYKLDISETDTHNPQQSLVLAEKKAARIYGSKTVKFLTNGSSIGIIASVLACVDRGEEVLVWKEAHPSHHNAIKLAGATPVYYEPSFIEDWGVYGETLPETIEPFLKNNKIKALIITSPTYEGFVSDIKRLKDLCQRYKTYLIVDEAHGALYPFCDKLPDSAVKMADFTVQSLHKTAGGLNPTALLHTTTDIDIEKALSLINTTSPSYPLLASIEANINYLNSKKGRQKIENLIAQINELKLNCPNCTFGGDDSTKILVKKDNLSGEKLSEILFDKYNIEDERTNAISTMLLCGIGTDKIKLKKLQNALKNL